MISNDVNWRPYSSLRAICRPDVYRERCKWKTRMRIAKKRRLPCKAEHRLALGSWGLPVGSRSVFLIASHCHTCLGPSTSSIGLGRTRLAIRLKLGAYGGTKIGGREQGPLHPSANRGKVPHGLETSDGSVFTASQESCRGAADGCEEDEGLLRLCC